MKKFYALAVAVAAAVSANAQLYVCGAGDGLGWEPTTPLEATTDASGNYTFTVDNLTEFKMSTAKGNWDAFNGGALWCSPSQATFGTPIELVKGDANIRTPWPGNYTVTVSPDYKTAIFTTDTPKPIEKIDIYVRGDMNGWGAPADWKFQTEDYIHYSLTCKIPAGQQFKIADANWSRANYGGQAAYGTYTWWYNSSNASFAQDFDGTIEFDFEAGAESIEVNFKEAPFVEPGVDYQVYGTLFGQYMTDTPMTNNEGTWTLSDVYTEGGRFWIRRYDNGTLDTTLGVASDAAMLPLLDTTYETSDAANVQGWWLERGLYTIIYNAKMRTVTITGNVYPATYEIPETLYIIGTVDGEVWSTTNPLATQKEGDIFTANNVTVDAAEGSEYGYFSFLPAPAADWDEANSNDRYGASTLDALVELGEPSQMFIFRAASGNAGSCNAWKIVPGDYDFTVDFANMTLTVVKAGTTGVSDITTAAEAPVYYNLQGVRVANPANGLFIEVRGGASRKVIIK